MLPVPPLVVHGLPVAPPPPPDPPATPLTDPFLPEPPPAEVIVEPE